MKNFKKDFEVIEIFDEVSLLSAEVTELNDSYSPIPPRPSQSQESEVATFDSDAADMDTTDLDDSIMQMWSLFFFNKIIFFP